MSAPLRISLIQTDLVWENPHANHEALATLLAPLQGKTDLIVLPEMFSTGFTMNPAQHAEPESGPSLNWLKEQAVALKVALCGSIATRIPEGYVNRFLLVTPEGEVQHYDKRHLFRMSQEIEHYRAGTERKIFTYKQWRILPQVCYDLRFPVFMRNRNDYDLALVVANWPSPRRMAWRTLLQARAIENQCYVVGVNRIGNDGLNMSYSGDSLAVDFKGEILIDKPLHSAFTATLPFDYAALQDFRTKFPAWLDADEFSLN